MWRVIRWGTLLLVVGVVAVAGFLIYDSYRDQHVVLGGERDTIPVSSSSTSPTGHLILRVTMQPVVGGDVYHVYPSRRGRLAVGSDLDAAYHEAVELGLPRAANIRQQFMCHPLSLLGRAKSTWDLENWRPTVGLGRTMLDGCNP